MTILTNFRQKQLQPFVRLLLLLAALAAGSYLLNTDPSVNLWSLGYLWQKTDQTLAFLLPVSTTTALPTNHINGATWQARDALAHGDSWLATQLLAPAITYGSRDAMRLQAELLVQQGDYAGANLVWAQLEDVEALLQAGLANAQTGELAEALAAYRAAYMIAPERTVLPLAHFLWSNNGDDATAEALLADAVRTYQGSRYSYEWLRELGAVYQSQQKWDKAASIYEQVIAVAPDRIQERIALGWVYYERGDGATKALTQFEQAIAAAPQAGAGYYAIASLLTKEKRYADADPWYRQAIELEPTQSWWWVGRANTLQQADNLSSALQLFAILQKRFPDFAQGYYQAAWAYKEIGDRKQAVSAIEKALQLINTNDVEQRLSNVNYYIRAGQIYEWRGNVKEAASAYEQAQRLDPQRQDVRQALQRLYGN